MKHKLFLAVLCVASVCLSITIAAQESTTTGQKAILVTGASTGIGRHIAETLAAEGHFVYAGARKQKDLDALSAIENIQGIKLDVTIQAEIDAAVETISNAGRGLYGLINNAGVAVIGPMIEVDEEDMQFQMDVNLFGPYRVTRAFAPLIIESKGRITTTGSISGILSGQFAGPYSMSKHAIEAFTDSLAREMDKFDVQVSVVEPGNYNSVIFDTLLKRMENRGQTAEGSLYQEDFANMLERASVRPKDKEPDEVSAAFLHALFDPKPKRRYMVVPNENQAEITIKKAIEELAQLNERQQYSYDRDALIAMLDEALATGEE
jgi:NAD(P)-dependent dehydrogenase (short-subunit alcohol dehydrogenase family)